VAEKYSWTVEGAAPEASTEELDSSSDKAPGPGLPDSDKMAQVAVDTVSRAE